MHTDDRGPPPWALLAAGVAIVYSQTLSAPFLLDDRLSVIENHSIRHLWPIWSALTPPNEAGVGGRALLNLSFAVNYAINGTAVTGYHIVNLLIHILACVTLFALVRSTLARPILAKRFGSSAAPLALAIAAIWALDPIQTESVTYISERAESLMGLFYLLTLYFFSRGADARGTVGGLRWYALATLACAAGLATKEVAVSAPLMVLLYDRTFISGSFRGAFKRNSAFYLALAATLLLLEPRIVSLMKISVVYGVGFGGAISPLGYALTECRVIVKYILLAIWPAPLVFDYGPCTPSTFHEVWPYVIVVVSLAAATVVAVCRSPILGFAGCWFLLILAPTSSIVPIVGQAMAENRMYLPLAGVAALVVLGAFALLGRPCLPILAILAFCLAVASVCRNEVYLSELAIWDDTVAKAPENPRAHYNLGNIYSQLPGRTDDAIAQYEKELQLRADYPEGHNNLGSELSKIPGRINEAIAQYQEALRLRPDFAEAHNNMGNALQELPGRTNEAIAQYKEALHLRPDYPEAHSNLGGALRCIPGKTGEAINEFEEALRLDPDLLQAHSALWQILSGIPGRGKEAMRHHDAIIRLRNAGDRLQNEPRS